jgi:hypothetical protein
VQYEPYKPGEFPGSDQQIQQKQNLQHTNFVQQSKPTGGLWAEFDQYRNFSTNVISRNPKENLTNAVCELRDSGKSILQAITLSRLIPKDQFPRSNNDRPRKEYAKEMGADFINIFGDLIYGVSFGSAFQNSPRYQEISAGTPTFERPIAGVANSVLSILATPTVDLFNIPFKGRADDLLYPLGMVPYHLTGAAGQTAGAGENLLRKGSLIVTPKSLHQGINYSFDWGLTVPTTAGMNAIRGEGQANYSPKNAKITKEQKGTPGRVLEFGLSGLFAYEMYRSLEGEENKRTGNANRNANNQSITINHNPNPGTPGSHLIDNGGWPVTVIK